MSSHPARWFLCLSVATLFVTFTGPAHAAQPPVGLGTSTSFAILAGSTVTNTGPSVVNGDLGLSPGPAISGFGGPGNGTINGATHVADAVALQAKADLDTAYSDAAGRSPAGALPPDLATVGILGPGVYRASSALQLTGPVTLDAAGDPSAVFVFQVGSALTTASASSVRLVNGAQPCNVFWQIGSSATLGSGSTFVGTILADQSVSVNDAVTIQGRALARIGAVTLINDTITRSDCATPTSTPTSSTTAPGTAGAPGSTSGPGGSTPPAADAAAPVQVRLDVTGKEAAVSGGHIAQVVFLLDGRVIRPSTRSPLRAPLTLRPGRHTVTARITVTTDRRVHIRKRRFTTLNPRRPPQSTLSRPPKRPGGFTG